MRARPPSLASKQIGPPCSNLSNGAARTDRAMCAILNARAAPPRRRATIQVPDHVQRLAAAHWRRSPQPSTEAAAINGFKIKIERIIRRGAEHPAVRARFVARAALLRTCDLDAAIVTIERWRRDEQRAFAIASAFGRGSGLSLQVLDELRLLLRWLRVKRLHADYATARAALSGDAPALEAAE